MLLGRAKFMKYKALELQIVAGRIVSWDLAQCRAQMKERQARHGGNYRKKMKSSLDSDQTQ